MGKRETEGERERERERKWGVRWWSVYKFMNITVIDSKMGVKSSEKSGG